VQKKEKPLYKQRSCKLVQALVQKLQAASLLLLQQPCNLHTEAKATCKQRKPLQVDQ
jgi:hypothetical protein